MKKKKGVILDIDGVLIHGVAPIPGARDALQRLEAAGLPTAFVTNGGGVPRQEKAKALGKTLQMPEEHFAARLCAAHDPIPELLRARGSLFIRMQFALNFLQACWISVCSC
jgi:ribonucleotide monophosphatase NagD (HAD superfamily)